MPIIPEINVYEEKTAPQIDETRAGRVLFIGAFDAEKHPAVVEGSGTSAVYTFDPQNVNTEAEAKTVLGTDTTNYPALKCIEPLFKGATSLLTINMTVAGDTPDKTISALKLGQALNTVLLEKFDIIFVADSISDELLAVIKAFDATRHEDKRPFDFVGVGTRSNASAYTTSAALMPRSCNFITQTLEEYTLVETGALITGLIAGNILDVSLTNMTVPDVDSIGTEYTFGSGDLGYTLVSLGYTVFKMTSRLDGDVKIVNGRQFNLFDGYINRVTGAIIRDFLLEDYLGKKNNKVTLIGVNAECARIKNKFCKVLGFAKDIEYFVEKANAECVVIKLTKIVYDGVITQIDLYYTVELE